MLAPRLLRWLTYAVAFALLPMATSLLLRTLTGTMRWEAIYGSPELLFFSLMISAVGLGDISELTREVRTDIWLRFLFSALLFGAIISGILYGALVHDQIMTQSGEFQRNIFHLSIAIASIYLMLGTIVQGVIGYAERDP